MAKNKSTVYLGYDDEEIPTKQATVLTSCTNKIGGIPNWPRQEVTVPTCPLCGTVRPLIVQMYAPLERSQFHRNLYIFACLNPTCSQKSKSWVCVRTQHLDTPNQFDITNEQPTKSSGKHKKNKQQHGNKAAAGLQKVKWCSGADDWGDSDVTEEAMDLAADDEQNERNGNIRSNVLQYDNMDELEDCAHGVVKLGDDDDDDESTSAENDLIYGFGQIDVNSQQNAGEDPNANCAAAAIATASGDGGGASALIYAEIEGTETDVVLVDTPKKPERDLIALLKHTSSPATLGPLSQVQDITLKSFYIAVDVETSNQHDEYESYDGLLSMDHIRDLYQEYKLRDENPVCSPLSPSPSGSDGAVAASAGPGSEPVDEKESYEKAMPAHGDIIFHNFITTIQQNPGQILRYSRDALPLLVAPLTEQWPKCQNCKGETICEVQLLPTLIPKLRLQHNSATVPIEFGNVLVFTCLKSCWDTPDKMRYEHVIVQSEA